MNGRPWALLGLAVAAAARAAEPASLPDSTASGRRAAAITIYSGDFALVREIRELELDRAVAATMRVLDVPARLDPRTVHVRPVSGPGELAVLEQNYRTGLLSPQELLERYVGREVELVEQAEDLTTRTTRATLLSLEGGPVYRIGDRVVIGQTGKVLLPELPPDLVARPTLFWTLRASQPGRHRVELSYLTEGMSWSADYVAVLDSGGRKADLTGWVTVENRCGAGYTDAALELVAGDVRRVGRHEPLAAARAEAAAAPSFAEEPFFEYHVYGLERPATLADGDALQLRLLEARGVPVTKRFLLVGSPSWHRAKMEAASRDQRPSVVLEIRNARQSGLGVPLPRGVLRVYERDGTGAERFAGENRIGHTAKDETLRVEVGSAFDLVAERVQTEYRAISPRQSEASLRISIRNHKDEDVTVTVREPVGGDFQVLEASHPWKKPDAGTVEFDVPVPRAGETALTYRVSVRW